MYLCAEQIQVVRSQIWHYLHVEKSWYKSARFHRVYFDISHIHKRIQREVARSAELSSRPVVKMRKQKDNLLGVEGVQEGSSGLGGLLGRLLLGLLEDLGTTEGLGIGVETVHDGHGLEGVLLLGVRAGGLGGTGSLQRTLNLSRVDDTGNIRVGHDVGGEGVVLLEGRGLAVSTVDLVQESESVLGPDDEAAHVSTGSELQQVEGADVGELNTGDVAESLDDTVVLGVDDEGTAALAVTTVTHLTNTSTELAGVGDLDDISVGVDGLEEGDGGLGLGQGLNTVSNNEGNLLDLLNSVTTGQDQGREGRGSQGRGSSETLLVLVGLDVPLAPDLGRGEHATTTAHVTESGLAGTVGTASRDTGNTGNSATGTPGLGRGLVTSLLGDGVGLAVVLVHVLVDELDNIRADRGLEDGRQNLGTNGLLAGLGENGNNGTSSLCEESIDR